MKRTDIKLFGNTARAGFALCLLLLLAFPVIGLADVVNFDPPAGAYPASAYSENDKMLVNFSSSYSYVNRFKSIVRNSTDPAPGAEDFASIGFGASNLVAPGQTVYVQAYQALGMVIDGFRSAAYTLSLSPCATPIAYPPGGSYASFPQSVALSCATPGATIYYTLDGSPPTAASTAYGGVPIPVNAGNTLKAIAVVPGKADSAIMTEIYTQAVGPKPASVGSVEPEAQPKPVYERAMIGRCREWTNVRSGPGMNYDVIGKAVLGETIELLQWNSDETWCKVLYNGGNNMGWVHGRFIVPQN